MYVYVLRSLKDQRYYIGCAKNLDKRIERHNTGKVKSTKYRRPCVLVYKEELDNYGEARRREAELKRMKGGEQFKKLINNAGVVQQ